MADRPLYTDDEIAAAHIRGEEEFASFPKPLSVRFDRESGRLFIELENETGFSTRARNLQGLEEASDDELADVEIEAGYALHWERLDVDFSIPGLLAGIFGTARFMAAKGGRSRSAAKSAAARKNGRQGGRPRKQARPTG